MFYFEMGNGSPNRPKAGRSISTSCPRIVPVSYCQNVSNCSSTMALIWSLDHFELQEFSFVMK